MSPARVIHILVATILLVALALPGLAAADHDNGRGRGHGGNDRGRGHDDDPRPQQVIPEQRDDADETGRRVHVCHATGSDSHPFVFITINEHAVPAHERKGDIIGVNSEADCLNAGPGQVPPGAPGSALLALSNPLGQITLFWESGTHREHRVYLGVGTSCVFTEFRSVTPGLLTTMLSGLAPSTVYCLEVREVQPSGGETVVQASTRPLGVGDTIAIGAGSCIEGGICSFIVSRMGGSGTAAVSYTTASGTAVEGAVCASGVDFIAAGAGSLSLGPNGTSTILVATCFDGVPEPNETFFVVLTGTSSGTLTSPAAQGIILGS